MELAQYIVLKHTRDEDIPRIHNPTHHCHTPLHVAFRNSWWTYAEFVRPDAFGFNTSQGHGGRTPGASVKDIRNVII